MRSKIETLLKLLPHKTQVEFALYCCNDVKHLIKEQASLDAIALTEAWLKDSASVTQEELRNASYAAASRAVYATSVASHAAYAAASAASAVAYAAYAAAHVAAAANAAANANAKNREKKLKSYYNYLISIIKDMPKVELEIYRININNIE